MEIGSVQNVSYSSSVYNSSQSSSRALDFEEMMEERRNKLEEAVNSGKIDPSQLQTELQNIFGDVVNEAFGEDGSIDFEKLDEIMQSQGPPPQGPPPPPPDGMGPPAGPSNTVDLDPDTIQQKLIDLFGDEAEGVVSEDGEIDFEKISELAEKYQASNGNKQQSLFSMFDPMEMYSQPIFVDSRA